MEAMCMEHYVVLLPFKPKRWVTCHQPQILEDAIGLMDAYMLAKAGTYLMKNLHKKAPHFEQGKPTWRGKTKPNLDPTADREIPPKDAGPEFPTLIFN